MKLSNAGSPVTIIVPVYGDWPSLDMCIQSLLKHVETRHKILLVNDCGPDVEMLETKIKHSIKGHANFEYYRNDKNRGFVQTCNRAVYELDKTNNDVMLLNSDTVVTAGFLEEMQVVMKLSDRHGVVGPRSNNATIASVPFRLRNNQPDRELDYANNIYQKIKLDLPRFVVTPVVVGFCMLIRRDLIKNFELFDETYGLGYSEENDFCLRINQYGYSAVMCNHAFVYHLESRSFTSEKKAKLVERNEAIMVTRYPYYRQAVDSYINYQIDAVDWFADVIAGPLEPIKVLVNLYQMPFVYNGTARNSFSLLEHVAKYKSKQKIEFVILTTKDAEAHHNLGKYGLRIVHPDDINELFHVAVSPAQIFHLDNLLLLNRYCLKIVIAHLDNIAVRTQSLLANDYRQKPIFEDSFMLANKIVTISDFTAADTFSFFGESATKYADKLLTIHQGYPDKMFEESYTNFPGKDDIKSVLEDNKDFAIVYGNDYSHKLITPILSELEKANILCIIVGPSHIKAHASNIKVVPSGHIPDAYLAKLLMKCKVVVFPSSYEGFGLPILEAAWYGKPILLNDTTVSREIVEVAKTASPVSYFQTIDQISSKLNELVALKSVSIKNAPVRLLGDYTKSLLELTLRQAQSRDIDIVALRARWYYFSHVAQYVRHDPGINYHASMQQTAIQLLRKNPKLYHLAKRTYRKIKG